MKKFMRNILSIVVSAALLISSTIPVLAEDHSHGGGKPIEDDSTEYTITLTKPEGYPEITDKNADKFSYGAYQIFSGMVPTNPVSVDGSIYNKENDGYQNPGDELASLPITDIKWGNAFGEVNSSDWQDNIVSFVLALAAAPTGDYKYAFHDFTGFEEFADPADPTKLLNEKYYIDSKDKVNSKVNFDKLAVDVAEVLADDKHKNNEWLQAFTDILGGYAAPEKDSGKPYGQGNYVTQYYPGEWNDDYSKYEIKVPAGYYMIKDLSTIGDGDSNEAYSARMLFVASDVTQVLKESVPELEKQIERDSADYETEVAGVGDIVTYKLTGTLPSNYDNYLGGYQYIFTDTLSKGLTLNEIKDSSKTYVTVTAKGWFKTSPGSEPTWDPEKTLEIQTNSYDASKVHGDSNTHHLDGTSGKDSAYIVKVDDIENGGGTLTVTFPCLKEIVVEEDGTQYRLGYNSKAEGEKSSQIYITYTATVNENAVVSPEDDTSLNGNMNSAQLEYSDNPQSYSDTDKTTTDTATVYTFGLDIVKIDAAQFLKNDGDTTEDGVVIDGAKFAVVRPVKKADAITGWEIAQFKFVDADPDSEANLPDSFKEKGYYSIVSWETIKKDGVSVADTTFDPAWLDTADYNTDADAAKEGYNITTKDGGLLNVSGFDAGVTYTMVETETPKGTDDKELYAKIAPFTIILAAQKDKDEYTGKLASVTLDGTHKSEDGAFTYDKFVRLTDTFTGEPVAEADGSAKMLVANFKYEDLPSTGGMGTYLYYIIGGGVILLAAVLFFLSRKKPAKTVK